MDKESENLVENIKRNLSEMLILRIMADKMKKEDKHKTFLFYQKKFYDKKYEIIRLINSI